MWYPQFTYDALLHIFSHFFASKNMSMCTLCVCNDLSLWMRTVESAAVALEGAAERSIFHFLSKKRWTAENKEKLVSLCFENVYSITHRIKCSSIGIENVLQMNRTLPGGRIICRKMLFSVLFLGCDILIKWNYMEYTQIELMD